VANLLKNLAVTRVSLVNRAAVRDPANPTEPQRLLLWKSADHDDQGGNMPPTINESLAAALAKADLSDSAREAIEKAQERETALAKATSDLAKASTDMAALTAKVTDLEKAAKKPAGSTDDAEDEVDIEKADVPEPIKAMLRKAQAQATADRERLEKAETETREAKDLAKAEQNARLTAEFIKKAETLKSLSQDPAKFGPVLKSAAEKLTKDESDELDRVLKAADEQVRAGLLLKEMGKGGQPAPGPDSAISKAQAKAVELQKSDPKLTAAQALDKAMEGDKELQAAYLAEQRG
jgi:hypothetical protein